MVRRKKYVRFKECPRTFIDITGFNEMLMQHADRRCRFLDKKNGFCNCRVLAWDLCDIEEIPCDGETIFICCLDIDDNWNESKRPYKTVKMWEDETRNYLSQGMSESVKRIIRSPTKKTK